MVELRVIGTHVEKIILPDMREARLAQYLALSEEGGYEDVEMQETEDPCTHLSAFDWFNEN